MLSSNIRYGRAERGMRIRRNRVVVAGLLLTGATALIVTRPGQAMSGGRPIALDGSPSALALDPRTGHAFVAFAGPNGSGAGVSSFPASLCLAPDRPWRFHQRPPI